MRCHRRSPHSIYIFAAVEPGTDNGFALVMPHATYRGDAAVPRPFRSDQLAEDEHVVMVLDQAGWHGWLRLWCPATSRSCRYRLTPQSSIPWKGSGYTSRSGSSRTACMQTTTQLPMPPAPPGTGWSPRPGMHHVPVLLPLDTKGQTLGSAV